MGELTQRSLPFMYAQTLLRGDKKKGDDMENSRISQSLLKESGEQKYHVKPQFNKRVVGKSNNSGSNEPRYGKSFSKNEIGSSKKNVVIHFENEEKNANTNSKNHVFNIRRTSNQHEEQKVKHWKKDSLGEGIKYKN